MKIVYMANDETIFQSREECEKYERYKIKLQDRPKLLNALAILQEVCKTNCDCCTCYLDNSEPCAMKVLEKALEIKNG